MKLVSKLKNLLKNRTSNSFSYNSVLGEFGVSFTCCDTQFNIYSKGINSRSTVKKAKKKAIDLENQLNSFDQKSDISKLNRDGIINNKNIVDIIKRGLEYHKKTNEVFDIAQGKAEKSIKKYIDGKKDSLSPENIFNELEKNIEFEDGEIKSNVRLDLNGLAKGYIVDRVYDIIKSKGRTGYVDGGGDIIDPQGRTDIESPYEDKKPLKILDTKWSIASSGGYRRKRKNVDHIYNPAEKKIGSRHDLVTVVAKRDCMEADALATTLSVLTINNAIELAERWDGLEALILNSGIFHKTDGFLNHVAK